MKKLFILALVWIDDKSADWRWVEWLNRNVIDRGTK